MTNTDDSAQNDDLEELRRFIPVIEMFDRREQMVLERSLKALEVSLTHLNHLTVIVVAIVGAIIPLAASQAFQPDYVRTALACFAVALVALVLEQLGTRWAFGFGFERFARATKELANAVGAALGAGDGSVGDAIARLDRADQKSVQTIRRVLRIAGVLIHAVFLAAFISGAYFVVMAGFYVSR